MAWNSGPVPFPVIPTLGMHMFCPYSVFFCICGVCVYMGACTCGGAEEDIRCLALSRCLIPMVSHQFRSRLMVYKLKKILLFLSPQCQGLQVCIATPIFLYGCGGFELRYSYLHRTCWAIFPASWLIVKLFVLGDGGTCLWSKHSRGRSRQISEFEVSLVYGMSSRTANGIQRNLVSRKPNQNKTYCLNINYIYMNIYACAHVHVIYTCVEGRGQLMKVSSLLLPCESRGLNPGW